MTGIVILPAGRDDAFEDYKQFIRDGHPIEDIESDLNNKDIRLFRTPSDDDLVHVWGTPVDGSWWAVAVRAVGPGVSMNEGGLSRAKTPAVGRI